MLTRTCVTQTRVTKKRAVNRINASRVTHGSEAVSTLGIKISKVNDEYLSTKETCFFNFYKTCMTFEVKDYENIIPKIK